MFHLHMSMPCLYQCQGTFPLQIVYTTHNIKRLSHGHLWYIKQTLGHCTLANKPKQICKQTEHCTICLILSNLVANCMWHCTGIYGITGDNILTKVYMLYIVTVYRSSWTDELIRLIELWLKIVLQIIIIDL